MLDENVVQPLLVSTSAINLATECVRMILKVGSHPSQNLEVLSTTSLKTGCYDVFKRHLIAVIPCSFA